MINSKLAIILSVLVGLVLFYLWSINNAYHKGYNQHALEVAQTASEVVLGSNTDILVAAQEVKKDEQNIKTDDECGVIWNFDLRKCLHK